MERNYNLDILRIIAAICILALHIFGVKGGYFNTLIYYIGTPGIPLFFLISGYNMLSKKRNFKEILYKILNIYVFLAVLSAITGIIYIIIKGKSLIYIIDIFNNIFMQKGSLAIMWFMVALSIIYLITPALYKIKDNKKVFYGLILLSSVIFTSNFFLNKYYGKTIKDLIIQPLRIWTWITYYIMGYKLRKDKNNSKKINKYIFILMSILSTNYEFFIGKYLISNFYAEIFYDSLIIKIWILTLYYLIMNFKINEKYDKIIVKLSKATFGVYVFQIPVIKIIYHLKLNRINIGINILLFLIVTATLFIFSCLINKNKFLNKIFNLKILKENI